MTATPLRKQPNEFVDFVRLYQNDPVGFVRAAWDVEPDEWQAQVLRDVAAGERRIAVRSGHGVGKSTCMAWATIWYITVHYPVKVVVTAPTTAQLFDALFAEIKAWVRKLPPVLETLFEVKAERIELKSAPNECFISARTSRAEAPDSLQGVHSEWVMLVADEASGIPEQVFEAAGGSMSGHNAVTICLGNPVRSSGFFYNIFHSLAGFWRTYHVSCIDSKRVSEEYVKQQQITYGEDSNAYRIRVLGEFPKADNDSIIPMELLETARLRDVTAILTSRPIWGVDVARFGADKSSLAKRRANFLIEPPLRWAGLDTMQVAGAVHTEWERTVEPQRPSEILIDVIGIGAGVTDRLRQLKLPARGINVSESPAMGAKYVNLRAELWHKTKEWLEKRDCKIPSDDLLISELASVRYFFTTTGKMQVESKDAMRKRGQKSPDSADAFVLTFAGSAATAIHGYASDAGKSLRRNIQGIV